MKRIDRYYWKKLADKYPELKHSNVRTSNVKEALEVYTKLEKNINQKSFASDSERISILAVIKANLFASIEGVS